MPETAPCMGCGALGPFVTTPSFIPWCRSCASVSRVASTRSGLLTARRADAQAIVRVEQQHRIELFLREPRARGIGGYVLGMTAVSIDVISP